MSMLDISLGQLARKIPGATAVFHKYELDFCCGGNKTLGEVAAVKQIDPQGIVDDLNQLLAVQGSVVTWDDATNAELINHILVRYHQVHRQQFEELIRLANRVETVHYENPNCPIGLAAHLEKMQDELVQHMCKEETILFPMLAQGAIHLAAMPVQMMRNEHLEHGEHLAELERLTHGMQHPKGACNTWRALYLGLRTFKEDLMEHIHLENNLLFERVAAQVPAKKVVEIMEVKLPAEQKTCCGHC
jgi:regulator of cell morphogenesis and NO signaling